MHKLSAASAKSSGLTLLRSLDLLDVLVDLLDVLHKYACGASVAAQLGAAGLAWRPLSGRRFRRFATTPYALSG